MSEKRNFDTEAASWDTPQRAQIAREIADAMKRAVPLSTRMKVLDYGCGTGLLTLELAPCVGPVTGVDSSSGMLRVLKDKVRSREINNVSVKQMDLELEDELTGGFDLIISSMVLHHVKRVPSLLERFHGLLVQGGRLALADLDEEGGDFHCSNEGVFHFGFDRQRLNQLLVDAGFKDVSFATATEVLKPCAEGKVRSFPIFLVTARA